MIPRFFSRKQKKIIILFKLNARRISLGGIITANNIDFYFWSSDRFKDKLSLVILEDKNVCYTKTAAKIFYVNIIFHFHWVDCFNQLQSWS